MMKRIITALSTICILLFAGCSQKTADNLMVNPSDFDTTLQNKQVRLFTARNDNGMVVQFTNYGARVVTLIVPDRDGKATDVIWGYDNINGYLTASDPNAGPVVGRFGNRIAQGKFSIDGKDYQLTINNGRNHLHGGTNGFFAKVWDGKEYKSAEGDDVVEMTYLSPDGEEGYPGNMNVKVVYTLKKDNSLQIEYSATTDQPTPCNLTFHPYLNLHGTTAKSSNSHVLWVDADFFTPTDNELIPTGEILSVEGTPVDFRSPHTIGERTNADSDIIRFGGGGYDMNFVLNKKGPESQLVAYMYEPANGINLEIFTDRPGLQFYSGPCMNNTDKGKRGDILLRYGGVALETQNYPDSPNQSNFPDTILKPGEEYTHFAIFKFSVK